MKRMEEAERAGKTISVPAGAVRLEGSLEIPEEATSLVVFAHGSGSGRHSPRNRFVAESLQDAGLATLLFDLLSADEEKIDLQTTHLRFDIAFLAERLMCAIEWSSRQEETRRLKIGCFGSSTGAGAALVAAAEMPGKIEAVVSRGGRPDLAGSALSDVRCPALMIVGGNDVPVIELNKQAMARMTSAETKLEIIPGATHLFEEPGTLEKVADLAGRWFVGKL
jgi:putative phosphoribosyl transferase